jgi:hypothetical protein
MQFLTKKIPAKICRGGGGHVDVISPLSKIAETVHKLL